MSPKYKGMSEDSAPWQPIEGGPLRHGVRAYPAWKLEDAKARFSEVVRMAQNSGPQRVTRRGEDAVVILSAEDFATLLAGARPRASLVDFLRTAGLSEIPVERELDRGRDVTL